MSRSKRRAPRRRPLDVLYEDPRWVAIDKPAGIPVHGGAGRAGPSVLERLEEERGEKLLLAHRLDRSTAGVLLLARTPDAAREAGAWWDEVTKTYFAVVAGRAVPGILDAPLPDPDGRARAARTEVEATWPLQLGELTASLCRLSLHTGRLHQIRRHLAGAGHPVLMDDKHGDFRRNRELGAWAAEQELARPKHLLLRCARLRPPARAGLPVLEAPWPRTWPPLLTAGGGRLDDLDGLT